MRDDVIPIEFEVDFDRRPPAQINPDPNVQNQEQMQEMQPVQREA